jgi:hypothetical protein
MKSPEVRWSIMLLVAAVVVLSIGCVGFAYLWIDRSITLSYVEASQQTTAAELRHLAQLLTREWAGLSRSTIEEKLTAEAARRASEGIIVKSDPNGNVLWFDNLRFIFEESRLQRIE